MIIDLDKQINDYCRFCKPKELERILYESENFYIMLSLGPIVEGYLLLVSKKHFGCCAEIPQNFFDEFNQLYIKIRQILTEEYGSCISYEHGKAGSCLVQVDGSKHCFHAHMHFVPVKINLNESVANDFNSQYPCKSLIDFRQQNLKESSPYLFVHDNDMVLYQNVYDIRSQYLRYKTSTLIEETDLWDWVKFQGWDKINSAASKLKSKFQFYDGKN